MSAHIGRDATATTDGRSSDELANASVDELQKKLAQSMPAEKAERFANVLRKIVTGSSAENMAGVVRFSLEYE